MRKYNKPNVADKDATQSIDTYRRTITNFAWMTPVISVVSLPAHAQTSATTTSTPACTSQIKLDTVLRGEDGGCVIDTNTCRWLEQFFSSEFSWQDYSLFTELGGGMTITTNVHQFTAWSYFRGEDQFVSESHETMIRDRLGRLWVGDLTYTNSRYGTTVVGILSLA